ncbi:hypothetical protein [Actinoplanes sp. URMC 104]|uniref:hypothetical protein n=1 Tax=Actinoplanes sp. URMC 104 TaxID=3423409 RepID=UPI003F1D11DD
MPEDTTQGNGQVCIKLLVNEVLMETWYADRFEISEKHMIVLGDNSDGYHITLVEWHGPRDVSLHLEHE